MEEEIWWSCTLDKQDPEYSWPPEDYVKGLESNAKVQRLLIKNAVLAPEAVKDEVVVVQIECEGLNNRKVIAPIVAMKGGQDNQLHVDLQVPGPARLKIVAGQGPIHLTGSHCLDFNEQSECGDNEEAKEISEVEGIKEDLGSKLQENLIENSKVKINEVGDKQTEREDEVCVKTEFDPKSREVVEHMEVGELKEIKNDIKEESESKASSKNKLETEENMETENKKENQELKVVMGKTEVLEINTVENNQSKKGKSGKTGNKPDLVHSYLEKQLITSTPIKSETEKGIFQVPKKRKREGDKQAKTEKNEMYINLEEIAKMKWKSSHDFSSEQKKKAKTSFNNELNPEETKIKKTVSEPILLKKESCKSPVKSRSLAHSKGNKAIKEVSLEVENNPKAYEAIGSNDLKGRHEQNPGSGEETGSERGKLTEAIQENSPDNNKGAKTEAKGSKFNKKPSQMSQKGVSVPKSSRMIQTTSANKTSSTAQEKNFNTPDKSTAKDENCKTPERSGVSPGAIRAGVTIGKASKK